MFWKAQGVAKNKNELRGFITDNELDVARLTETFLKTSHTFNIPNYITYRMETQNLIRKEIKHYSIGTNTAKMETSTVDIHTERCITAPYAAYSSLQNDIEEANIDEIFNFHHPTILARDLNSKHPQWNSETVNRKENNLSKLLKEETSP
ncbi:hypothetical protein Trydic_g11714 [Trypoxylus dichotomus]